jgi:hypothetical protein
MLAAQIVVAGSQFVVRLVQWQIWVKAQIIPELPKAFVLSRAGQQFLPDWTQKLHDIGSDQPRDFHD